VWCVEGLNAKAMNVKKSLAILFVLVFLLHVAVILVLEKVDVGLSVITGEVVEYQEQAEITASRISEGNFSIHNLGLDHYFPVLVGYLYFVFGPHVVVGRFRNSAVCAYASSRGNKEARVYFCNGCVLVPNLPSFHQPFLRRCVSDCAGTRKRIMIPCSSTDKATAITTTAPNTARDKAARNFFAAT